MYIIFIDVNQVHMLPFEKNAVVLAYVCFEKVGSHANMHAEHETSLSIVTIYIE
jgi:hypothetical protein